MLKQELGDREFEQLWRLIHKMNLKKINFEAVEKLLVDKEDRDSKSR
jgi:hypothetical protein